MEQYEIAPSLIPIACVVHAMVYILADRLISTNLKSLAMTNLVDCLSVAEESDGISQAEQQLRFARGLEKMVRPSDTTVLDLVTVVYGGTYPGTSHGGSQNLEEEQPNSSSKCRSVLQDIELRTTDQQQSNQGRFHFFPHPRISY